MDLMDKYLAWSDNLAEELGTLGIIALVVGGIWIVSIIFALINVAAWYFQPI
jgi:hypothetical protein